MGLKYLTLKYKQKSPNIWDGDNSMDYSYKGFLKPEKYVDLWMREQTQTYYSINKINKHSTHSFQKVFF